MSDNKGKFKLFAATYTTSLFPGWVASPDYFNLFFSPITAELQLLSIFFAFILLSGPFGRKKNSSRMEREREKI
jgi:hypothetical protein